MYFLLENSSGNRSVGIKTIPPVCFQETAVRGAGRPEAEGAPHQVSCAFQRPPEERLASSHAVEHPKPVEQSESGHERTVWSLSCLKQ